MNWLQAFGEAFLAVWLEAAPWLLLGFVVAGLIHAFIPARVMTRWIGGRGFGGVVRAAIVGTPLPLCSCSVLPAGIALRRSGASKESTVSFFIATPENGVDSIALSYALLGPVFAWVRPVAALVSAVVAGGLTMVWGGESEREGENDQGPMRNDQGGEAEGVAGCCGAEAVGGLGAGSKQGLGGRVVEALRFGLVRMFDDLWVWLGVGLLLAAGISATVGDDRLASWGQGPWAYVVMLVVGVPMYICATASTPVAAALWVAGVSPGAVLVFLLAGPATNLATMAVVRKELGNGALGAYLVGVSGVALAAGVVLDVVAGGSLAVPTLGHHGHEHGAGWFVWVCGVVLAALFAATAWRAVRKRFAGGGGEDCCGGGEERVKAQVARTKSEGETAAGCCGDGAVPDASLGSASACCGGGEAVGKGCCGG